MTLQKCYTVNLEDCVLVNFNKTTNFNRYYSTETMEYCISTAIKC